MIKGGFWPVVELVDMHRFHSPFFLKKAHRYNTCPTIFVVFRLYKNHYTLVQADCDRVIFFTDCILAGRVIRAS
jgi:hypothetical protein